MATELDKAWFRRHPARGYRSRWPTVEEAACPGDGPLADGPLKTIVRGSDHATVTCGLPAPSRDEDNYLRFLFDMVKSPRRRSGTG